MHQNLLELTPSASAGAGGSLAGDCHQGDAVEEPGVTVGELGLGLGGSWAGHSAQKGSAPPSTDEVLVSPRLCLCGQARFAGKGKRAVKPAECIWKNQSQLWSMQVNLRSRHRAASFSLCRRLVTLRRVPSRRAAGGDMTGSG